LLIIDPEEAWAHLSHVAAWDSAWE